MSLSLITILWTLPIMFMIHEFEEIIMFRPWYDKYSNWLKVKHPRIERIYRNASASTPALSFGILEQFILISIVTLICVEYQFYSLWVGVLIAFLLHLVIHIGSFFIKRGYVPSVITSIIGVFYAIVVLVKLNDLVTLDPSEIMVWSLISLVILVVNLLFITMLIEKFDNWLESWVLNSKTNNNISNQIPL